MKTPDEWIAQVLEALPHLNPLTVEADRLLTYLYTANEKTRGLVSELSQYALAGKLAASQRLNVGRLMEKVAYAAFKGLRGISSIKSFQSAGPQYDLLVTGDEAGWLVMAQMLYMKTARRDVLIEAKGTAKKLGDKDVARLSAIMDQNLDTVGLGVFFTIRGASGFPSGSNRQRAVRDSRLRQALYHARTGRPIVVFDLKDIMELDKNGSLTTLLTRKIRDVMELSGLPVIDPGEFQEVVLPAHLSDMNL
jgi:hypothetical protein